MPKTNYSQPATQAAQSLMDDLFAIGGIGYVAVASGQEVLMREAPGMVSATTAESNFYEELLVNPTLLKLAGQRGGLDCGGLSYMAVGYGDFIQLIMPMRDGHVSLGISRKSAVGSVAANIRSVLDKHTVAQQPSKEWLLASTS